jgi:hypothetical protein
MRLTLFLPRLCLGHRQEHSERAVSPNLLWTLTARDGMAVNEALAGVALIEMAVRLVLRLFPWRPFSTPGSSITE